MTPIDHTRGDRTMRCSLALALVLGASWVLQPHICPTRRQREIQRAVQALADHRYPEAGTAAAGMLERDPNSPIALLLAAAAAAGSRKDETAIALYQRIAPDCPQAPLAEMGLAQGWQKLGKVELAERYYRRILDRDPSNLAAHRRLGFLLQSEGRTWESLDHLAALIFEGDFTVDGLLAVSSSERYFFTDPNLERTLAGPSPGDALIRLGEVRSAMLDGRERDVEPLLTEIVSRHPNVAEAQARLGKLIVDKGDRSAFLAWNGRLTAEHERHPEIWFVRGLFARREGSLPMAARCFLETLIRSPNHLAAHYQVAGCLVQLGEPQQATEFSRRVPLLSRVDIEINLIRKSPTGAAAERLIGLLQGLGRHWEAAGWANVAGTFDEPLQEWRAVYIAEASRLRSTRGLTALESQPARRVDLSRFPLPDWSTSTLPVQPEQSVGDHTQRFAGWRFADDTALAGLNFQYFEGSSSQTRLQHVFQTFGGGVGVIDFDMDGWPDLYLPQGNDWRRPVSESTTGDKLFRNTGGAFIDVAGPAGLGELAFSHGVAVGDYDNDGWPDLYVGNLGPNRFYHNNGDGTFSDVSAATGTQGSEWSTSCAIADLTGDGLPDIFVVNYADPEYAASHPCFVQGIEVSCTADALPPASNRVYVNLGDGRFSDASRELGIARETGLGLGLVVANFGNDGRPCVFVGNDTTPNFFFISVPTPPVGRRLVEHGIMSGVAFSAEGTVMASMGIAAGDANGDGRLDLFVTTFKNDSDKLFVQQADGSFADNTRRARLHDPTFAMLGFGAQFLDVDNDGWEDLAVVNGHVIAPLPESSGSPGADSERDKMPPQLLANLGDGTFAEVSSDTLGPFFGTRALGRGLAELDWNRDGRQDFCVSHLHAPVALVTNETATDDHRLAVRLIGVRESRDAFGAIATVRKGTKSITRHLCAGSGYLAANERRLWFGLGPAPEVDELKITWPGGGVQRWEQLKADQELLVIEDQAQPVVLRRWNHRHSTAARHSTPQESGRLGRLVDRPPIGFETDEF